MTDPQIPDALERLRTLVRQAADERDDRWREWRMCFAAWTALDPSSPDQERAHKAYDTAWEALLLADGVRDGLARARDAVRDMVELVPA